MLGQFNTRSSVQLLGRPFGETEGTDFTCHTSTTSGSLVCYAANDATDNTFYQLQVAINKSRIASGLPAGSDLKEDGIIGPLTVGLAQAVMGTPFAQNIVGTSSTPVDANSMAANASSFLSLFQQIAGNTADPSPTSPGDAGNSRQSQVPGIAPQSVAVQAQQAAASTNWPLWVGIGGGVVLVGVVAAIAYNQRKKRMEGRHAPAPKMKTPKRRRFFRRSRPGEEIRIFEPRGRRAQVRI